MTYGELAAVLRTEMRDTLPPYDFSDDEIRLYINESIFEAVDRGLMIYDRESFTVDIEIGVQEYQLDTAIIRVKLVQHPFCNLS
jgi:hypothetical protein